MKKTLLVTLGLMLASAMASAENLFGVTGGYNLSKANTEYKGPYYECKPGSGFNVGIAYEHRFKSEKKSYPFIDASILYSVEKGELESLVELNDALIGESYYVNNMKLLKVPVSFGYNFQLAEKFGIGPKVFGILDLDFSGYGVDPYFAFGGGVNLNIGERAAIGLGHDLNYKHRYYEGDIWTHNTHVNLTYYIFSK